MARHWISYSVDQDPRRRRRRGWQWRWPWDWGRGPRYGRPQVVRIQPTRRRVRDDGERRKIWPWLLLLLLLLLFALLLGWLLLDEREESERAEPTGGGSQPGAATDLPPGSVAPPVAPPVESALVLSRTDGGDTMVTVPERPSLKLDGDTRIMDLGDNSCHAQRYVLMTDGKMIPIDDLDEATVDALAGSDIPIDTIALSPDADTGALQAIASRTGGTFTKMD